ncbi:MAG: hydantoinase/oxoprolinase family protein, partial [Martelella sp.]
EYRYDKSLDVNIGETASNDAKVIEAKTLNDAWHELAERVLEEFELNGYSRDQVRLQPGYRMQYRGQLNDLEIDSPIGSAKTAEDWDRLVDAFNDTYGRVYAASARSPELGYSVTGAIMRGTVPIPKPRIPKEEEGSPTPAEEARLGTRKFYRKGKWVDAQLYQMERLSPGNRITGPAIIESDATTFVVPGGFETWLDGHRLFHLKEV